MRILWGPTGSSLHDLLLAPLWPLADVRRLGNEIPLPEPGQVLDTHGWPPDVEIQVDPLQRLGVSALQSRPWPLVALADRTLLSVPQWRDLLPLYAAWIPRDWELAQALQAAGALVTDVLQGWDPELHSPQTPLWPCLYLSIRPSFNSPLLQAALSIPEIHFHPQWDNPRQAQLLSQTKAVIIDAPTPLAAHWVALASGAALLCPSHFHDPSGSLQAEQHYLPVTPANLAERLSEALATPAPDERQLAVVWQHILAQIAAWNLPPHQPQATETQQRSYRINHADSQLWAELSLSPAPADQLLLGLRAWQQQQVASDTAHLPAHLSAWAHQLQAPPLQYLGIAYLAQHWRLYQQIRPDVVLDPEILSPLQWDPLYLRLCHQGWPVVEALEITLAHWDIRVQQAVGHLHAALQALMDLAERCSALWYDAAGLALRCQDTVAVTRCFQALAQEQPLEFSARIEGTYYAARHGQLSQAQAQWQQLQTLLPRFPGSWRHHELLSALGRQLFPPQQAPSSQLQIAWEGGLFSHHSFARINHALFQRLAQQPGLHLRAYLSESPEYPPDLTWTDSPYPVQILVSHCWPHRLTPPQEGAWAMIFPWEFGIIPQAWAEAMNQGPDEIWVPSAFVADSLQRAGVTTPTVTIPNGVDLAIFQPDGPVYTLPDIRGRCFLFVGGTLHRKGIDLLLKAWEMAFAPEDEVTLVIKDFGTKGLYSVLSQRTHITALQSEANTAPIHYLETDSLSDEEMAALYRRCDVYVHPYRGEGFGMPILEAMACGRPVIIPDAGPAPEFCPPEAGWYVASRPIFENNRNLGGVGEAILEPFYSEVEIPLLVEALRTAASCPIEVLHTRGQAAHQAAIPYGWEQMTAQVLERLQHLRPPYLPRRLRPQALQAAQEQWQQHQDAAALMALAPQDPGWWMQETLQALAQDNLPEAVQALDQAISGGLPLRETTALLSRLGIPAPQAAPYRTTLLEEKQPQSDSDLIVRLFPGEPPPPIQQAFARWYSEPQQAQNAPYELAVPLLVDFQHYHPETPPVILEESLHRYNYLSIIEAHSDWQTLLRAYCQELKNCPDAHLILKYIGDLDTFTPQLLSWLAAENLDPETIPALTLVQEPLQWETLPGLFTGSEVYIDLGGPWALGAQACGKPVISAMAAAHVQPPYAYRYAMGDASTLAYWMQCAYQEQWHQAHPAVRAYLQRHHDRHTWHPQLQHTATRLALQQSLQTRA